MPVKEDHDECKQRQIKQINSMCLIEKKEKEIVHNVVFALVFNDDQ